ncbi:MAG: hypothetical protein ACYCZD_11670 [Rhodanobacter sp.]
MSMNVSSAAISRNRFAVVETTLRELGPTEVDNVSGGLSASDVVATVGIAAAGAYEVFVSSSWVLVL